MNQPGILYIVATPIGHLADITLRALEILKQVDIIAAEDTRHSAYLLKHYGITTPQLALHQHNERERSAVLISKLQQGQTIALISDAGTPLISDPGYYLVHSARLAGIKVMPIPGPCALVAALSAAGLPSDSFCFEGFLPAKASARDKQLQALATETRTIIFYEAPHRILATLDSITLQLGADRQVVLARELTKTFETFYQGTVAEVLAILKQHPEHCKGEIVILIHGAPALVPDDSHEADRLLKILLAQLPLKQAVTIASQISQQPKNTLYQRALTLSQAEQA